MLHHFIHKRAICANTTV
ncbi:hypothetical protein D022_4140A, partial [Vibrio parahaemolyticus 12310]